MGGASLWTVVLGIMTPTRCSCALNGPFGIDYGREEWRIRDNEIKGELEMGDGHHL